MTLGSIDPRNLLLGIAASFELHLRACYAATDRRRRAKTVVPAVSENRASDLRLHCHRSPPQLRHAESRGVPVIGFVPRK